MATQKKSKGSVKSGSVSTRDNIRLVTGFILMLIGAFLFCSILSYLFYWKEDMSALASLDHPVNTLEFNNICGEWGAKVANAIVGGGFGLFAVIIPMIFAVVGWRLFRYKPLRLHRFLLIFGLVLVLGSLTLGFIFGTAWNLFGTGLGGAYGIALDEALSGVIGGIGTLLVIIASWILTGLLINRNFLQVVDQRSVQVATATRKAIVALKRRGENGEESETEEVETEESEEIDEDDILEEIDKEETPEEEPIEESEEEVKPEEVEPEPEEEPLFIVTPCEEDELDNKEQKDEAETVVDEEPMDIDKILGVDPEEETPTVETEVDSEVKDDNIVITVTHKKPQTVDESEIVSDLYDPTLDIAHYTAPTPQLLVDYKEANGVDEAEIFQNKERIRETLLHFHIPIISMTATVGPTVTLYEIVQEPGVKISRIQGLEDDLAQHLKAESVRIIAPIPGKGTVGIEVPNQTKQTVSMRSAICSPEFQNSKAELPVVIGRTIQNQNFTFDLAKLPHLLVAGATGQGM